jgi:formylglycine-generating enzyme required for sulfatase activity
MKITSLLSVLFLGAFLCIISADRVVADVFGIGENSFEIEFVTIGQPGNAADTTGAPNPAGSVPYAYRMGKYEISEQMIDKANALGGLGITKDTRGPNKPATVTWFEAAKFVNWLNMSTGATSAYKFDDGGTFQLWEPSDAGYDQANLYRNTLAKYFRPSVDEWYKAAYYDPTSGVYYDYPTGSDSVPDGLDFAEDPDFDAVFTDHPPIDEPNDVTAVGLLSPYGTAGQGGNVYEWEETDYDLVNDATMFVRGLRGGDWNTFFGVLSSSLRTYDPPGLDDVSSYGFRVVSTIPEPNMLLLGGTAAVCLLLRRGICSRWRRA